MKEIDDDGENDGSDVDDIDVNSFSSDEEEIETTAIGGISTAEQYKEILIQEEEELEKITDTLVVEEDDFKKFYRKYDKLAEYISGNNRRHQDITPMFVDGTPFLIDGTSLVTCIIQDTNYCTDNGGQTLHFIYLCERVIELICRKGGTCEIVFFNDKNIFFQDIPEYFVALSILKLHLKKNTDLAVYEMESIFSSQFHDYITEVHPCFIIIDFSFIESFKEQLTEETADLAEKLFKYYEIFALALGLYCVDICHIELFHNMLCSFVSNVYLKSVNAIMRKSFIQFSKLCLDQFSPIKPIKFCDLQSSTNKNIRKLFAIHVAKMLYDDNSKCLLKNNELVKLFLFYNSILECLPLSCRSIDSAMKFEGHVPLIVKKILIAIGICLQSDSINNLDCALIADLWHGNMFVYTVECCKDLIDRASVGTKLDMLYKELLSEFNKICGQNLKPYPILTNDVKEKLNKISSCESLSNLKGMLCEEVQKPLSDKERDEIVDSNQMMLPLSDVVRHFCSDIIPIYYTRNLFENFKDIIVTNAAYGEKYHWHCVKVLTDDFDRIKDDRKENESLPLYKQQRLKAKFAHYMTLYGSNIEGKSLEHEPIVVCDTRKEIASKKKQKKLNKTTVSKKALKIREDNILNKQKEVLEVEKQKFDTFLKIYKTNKTGRLGDAKNLELVNQYLLNIRSDEFNGKLLYYKTEILYQLWNDQCQREGGGGEGDRDIDLTRLKELFLVVRSLLHYSKSNKSLLVDKQNQKLGKILCSIGFKKIAEKWNLPVDNEKPSVSAIRLSYIRFQLIHLGPDLERRAQGQVDDRVTGFIPDPWQRKLFDIVDKGQSALIVAPTSSGKTYASYYCMRKVLKESDEGRVVYVAPTKALVNQVAATIYARFKNKRMPDGMSVYGVFTRDYKHFAMDCQILVTVPECLELLLLSPRRYSWVKSLKYVIFDEIHCLAGQAGGITWERCMMLIQCPFLALSATIQNPREFWTWMQSVETFKKSVNPNIGTQVHLVVHSDRHNDLIRYIYGKDSKLHHIHPFAYLTDRVLSVHNGIPSHISLAPHETVLLYDVMTSVSPHDSSLSELDPDKYFNGTDTGFICRQDVKDYEKKLSSVFALWFRDNREAFHETINILYKPLAPHESGTKSFKYFQDNIVPFVENLRSKNMLPAIAFSYNRAYCEAIGEDLARYYKRKEEEYQAQKKKPLFQIQNYDDGDDLGGDDDERSSKGKKRQTSGKRDERLKRDASELFPIGLTKCLIEFSLRGKGRVDNKDLQFIERRLNRKFNANSNEVNQLRRGLGVHHSGITTVLRQSVEMLFRSKFLNVVFATGTLALGIHMPCKTVVIMGDSPYLNTLEYHQMSGRSGRRGFDKTGDVVFFGLDTDKMRVLMTSKLPRIMGNFPLTVSTVLRLLLLLTDVTEKSKKTEESYEATFNRVLTVLNEGMLYQTEKNLKDQMKHFVLFSCQLLMIQRLIDAECKPMLMAGLATHLHYHEPGNLAFIYILQSGILAKLCHFNADGTVNSKSCDYIVNLLCRLFTRLPLIKNRRDEDDRKYLNSLVKLPPLPDFVIKALKAYNDEVKTIFRCYFEGFSQHINETFGEDNKLPLSGKVFQGSCDVKELFVTDETQKTTLETIIAKQSNHNLICSAFAGLSGQTDDNLYCQNSLISNIRHQVFTDSKIVPLIDLETPLNGYAYDFYKHGIVRSIIEDNGLRSGQDYTCLLDFLLAVKSIETSLCELGMSHPGITLESDVDKNNLNRCVRDTFRQVKNNYESLFSKAYNVKERD